MFDRTVCINLDNRPDRWGAFRAKVEKFAWGDSVQRVRAIRGDTVGVPRFFFSGGGAWGCRQSHLRVLENALMDGVGTLCVFEDDVMFCPGYDEALARVLEALPDDWQVCMIGGQQLSGPGPTVADVKGTPEYQIRRSKNTQRTHAYVIRGREALQGVYKVWASCDSHIDHWNSRWQSVLACYEPDPFICGQDQGHSDILNRTLERRFWSSLNAVPEKDINALICGEQIAREARLLGCHFGYSLDQQGRDKGLTELLKRGAPVEELQRWCDMIVAEAVESDQVPCIWHPRLEESELKLLERCTILRLDSLKQLTDAFPSCQTMAVARDILWCWKGGDREVIEGLQYHGFFTGEYRDPITGLDNGVRQAMIAGDYGKLAQVAGLLKRQARNQPRKRAMVIHPDLDVAELRAVAGQNRVEELQGERCQDLVATFWAIIG